MRLFITLDYELYLGDKTGTPGNCLVKPMDELCRIADKFGIRYVIFVDAAYLLRLLQLKEKSPQLEIDFREVSCHIKKLSREGHDIQLHFHPQWLFSNYDNQTHQWNLNKYPYKLSDMKEEDVFTSFHDAKYLLENILGYRVTAFRAGGYCLSSFNKFKELFLREGIAIDSSVARDMFVKTPVHAYDYRNVPNEIIYKFDNDLCVIQEKGAFTELSISSVRWSGFHYMFRVRPMMAKYNPKIVYGDGLSITDKPEKKNNVISGKLKKFFTPYLNLVSIDEMRALQLSYIFDEAMKNDSQALVLIGHPKAATDASIESFESFINHCYKNVQFCTTRDL